MSFNYENSLNFGKKLFLNSATIDRRHRVEIKLQNNNIEY